MYSPCYKHSKQRDCNLLYPDCLDGLAHSTSKPHLMQNNFLLTTPAHTVISLWKMLYFKFEIAGKKGHHEIWSAPHGGISRICWNVLWICWIIWIGKTFNWFPQNYNFNLYWCLWWTIHKRLWHFANIFCYHEFYWICVKLRKNSEKSLFFQICLFKGYGTVS